MIPGVVSSSYTCFLQWGCHQRNALRHCSYQCTKLPVERIIIRRSRNMGNYGVGEGKVTYSGKYRAVRATGQLSLGCSMYQQCQGYIHYLFRSSVPTVQFVLRLYDESITFRNLVLVPSSGVNLSGRQLRNIHSQSLSTRF